MENVPVMISTKDLSYIEDIFNYNFTVCKLIHSFYEKVNDEEIKEFFKALYEGHKNICSNLINMLSLGDKNNG